jgi:hypothetical protein
MEGSACVRSRWATTQSRPLHPGQIPKRHRDFELTVNCLLKTDD